MPASVSSSELSSHQTGGALAGEAQITNILLSGSCAQDFDGCSTSGSTPGPSVSFSIDGPNVAKESAGDIPERTLPAAMVDVEPTDTLSIFDRALLRRFGQMESSQKNTSSIGVFSFCKFWSGLGVDGHPSNHSMNIFDRALLRRFPDAPSTMLSNGGTPAVISSPPRRVLGETTKKRKRFIGKGSTIKGDLSHGSIESLQKPVKSPAFPPSSHSLASVPDPAPSDFALLYFTLVKDGALLFGYLQDFLGLEVPARRAAKWSQVSAASISDSMASTALIELRKKSISEHVRLYRFLIN